MYNPNKGSIKKVIIFLVMVFIIAEVQAQDFKTYESGICIFNLQGCELSPAVEKGIVFGISLILETYKETFGFHYPNDYKVKVTIFADKDKFLKYRKKQGGPNVLGYGYYSYKYHETVAYWKGYSKKDKDAKIMIGTVFHEANHMILGHNIPWCPVWVNEGLSEYFAGLQVFGKNKRVYLQSNRSSWCKYWLKEGFPIELDEYVTLGYDKWIKFRKKNINAAYTIGYSLVYFLMSSSNTEKVLKELLWEFKKEGKKANSMKIINEYYPGGFAKLEKQWKEWIPKARSYRPLKALREHTDSKRMTNVLKGQLEENRKLNLLWTEALNSVSKQDFEQALDSIEQIAKVETENYYVFEMWGHTLLLYADNIAAEDKNKEKKLMRRAEAKYLKAESIEKGHCAYNLACICAFFEDEKGCRKWLKIGEETGNLPTLEYAKSDEDLQNVRDKEWFKKILWKNDQ